MMCRESNPSHRKTRSGRGVTKSLAYGAVADLPSEDVPTESDLLGPTRSVLESECVLPLALGVTRR